VPVRRHSPEREDKAARVPQSKQRVDTSYVFQLGTTAAFIKRSEARTPFTIISSSNQFKDKF